MAVYTHCCRAQPLRQLGFLVLYLSVCLSVCLFVIVSCVLPVGRINFIIIMTLVAHLLTDKKAVLWQGLGNRAMPQLFFSV